MTTPVQNKWSLANDAIKNTFTPGIAEEFGQWIGANTKLEPQTTLLDKIQQFFLQKNISLSLDDSSKILEGINMTTSNTNEAKQEDLQGLLTNHKVLKMGTEAKEEIGLLQDALRKLGYEIDDQGGKYRGIFGEQTENAVIEFQNDHGLVSDGIVGPKTLQALLNPKTVIKKEKKSDQSQISDDNLPPGIDKKSSADIKYLRPEIRATFPVIIDVFKAFGLPKPLITSGRDSDLHKKTSLHYKNLAIDIRGNYMPDKLMKEVAKEIQNRLGNKYDVVPEFFENPIRDHIHIEYHPKQ